MISTAKIIKSESAGEYVEVVFEDGTFVALSEEELRNAAALAEKGGLSD